MDPIPVRLTDEMQSRVDTLAEELSLSRSAVLRLAVQQWLDAVDERGMNPLIMEEPSSYPRRTLKRKTGGKISQKNT